MERKKYLILNSQGLVVLGGEGEGWEFKHPPKITAQNFSYFSALL